MELLINEINVLIIEHMLIFWILLGFIYTFLSKQNFSFILGAIILLMHFWILNPSISTFTLAFGLAILSHANGMKELKIPRSQFILYCAGFIAGTIIVFSSIFSFLHVGKMLPYLTLGGAILMFLLILSLHIIKFP